MSILSHMRSIGDRTYTANQNIVDGVVQEETIDTNLADEEVAEFKKDWDKNWHPMIGERSTGNWHPMIGERSTGIMSTFFKKLDNFLN